MVIEVKLFTHSKLPYSQRELAEQIRQVGELRDVETREVANEILKFMLDANVTYLKGK